jgi:hypothetical protein
MSVFNIQTLETLIIRCKLVFYLYIISVRNVQLKIVLIYVHVNFFKAYTITFKFFKELSKQSIKNYVDLYMMM